MQLQYQTVSPMLRASLEALMNESMFNDFVLVGGTALSLQLGHRKSVDIDLFSPAAYGAIDWDPLCLMGKHWELIKLDLFEFCSV